MATIINMLERYSVNESASRNYRKLEMFNTYSVVAFSVKVKLVEKTENSHDGRVNVVNVMIQ